MKPHDDTLSQVHDWLAENEVDASQLEYSPAKDWIKVSLSVASVARLLDTNYSTFEHADGSRLVRTPEWYATCGVIAHNSMDWQD